MKLFSAILLLLLLPALTSSKLTSLESAFLEIPTATSAKTSLNYITSKSHIAGSPGDHEMANYVQSEFEKVGIKSEPRILFHLNLKEQSVWQYYKS